MRELDTFMKELDEIANLDFESVSAFKVICYVRNKLLRDPERRITSIEAHTVACSMAINFSAELTDDEIDEISTNIVKIYLKLRTAYLDNGFQSGQIIEYVARNLIFEC